LIFARQARFEAREKLFHSSLDASANIQVATALNNKTTGTCSKTGLPTFFVDQSQQRGSTFGARFINAFKEVFEKGYENVIAIGNDCPDLNTEDLRFAQKSLEQNQQVLGPSCDGGVYLIGLKRSQFEAGILDKIHWMTNRVFEQLKETISGPVKVLKRKFDLDGPFTKRALKIAGKGLFHLWQIILQLFDSYQTTFKQESILGLLVFTPTLRGPPSRI